AVFHIVLMRFPVLDLFRADPVHVVCTRLRKPALRELAHAPVRPFQGHSPIVRRSALQIVSADAFFSEADQTILIRRVICIAELYTIHALLSICKTQRGVTASLLFFIKKLKFLILYS